MRVGSGWESPKTFCLLAILILGCASEPSPEEQRLATFERVIDAFADTAAFPPEVDVASIKARGRATLGASSSNETLYAAIWDGLRSFRKGHTRWSLLEGCGGDGAPPVFGESRYGFCLAPAGNGFVVSKVANQNPLGLARGDRIVEVDGKRGAAMIDDALARPTCGPVPASESARATEAADLVAAHVHRGSTLVVAGEGGERTVIAGDPSSPFECFLGPFSEPADQPTLTLVHDDVAWVRVPLFTRIDDDGTPTPENVRKRDVLRNTIHRLLDEGALHRGIVLDARGNRGGFENIAQSIAARFPGARQATVLSCATKQSHGGFGVDVADVFTPNGSTLTAPIVVLVDGWSASATDRFALMTKLATDVLVVGEPTLGFYTGIGGYDQDVPNTSPPMTLLASPERCLTSDGGTIEGRGVIPDVIVAIEPDDLRRGVDTALERAIRVVLAPPEERAALLAARR